MAFYRDIEVLRNEENALIKIHQILSDQLTRLKVEELALKNMLSQKDGENEDEEMEGDEEQRAGQTQHGGDYNEAEEDLPVDLNLEMDAQSALFASYGLNKEEEEEEEEEEEDEGQVYKDELTMFCDELSKRK